MHYGILGTTTATHDDGTPVPLGGARLRALLTALVLRQGAPVPAEVLVAEVWEDEPPQDAAAALQTLVGRLRRTLGRERVGSGPGGYWLTDPASDLSRFQALAAEGSRALAAGEPGVATEQLGAALALWRGPALADLPDRAGNAVRLEAQRAEARRAKLAAELELGRSGEVVAELAGLCADHPLDEPLHLLWLRALRESGRTAEALERYEQLRQALADQLGADPSAELRAVHRELLTQQEPPGPPRATARPTAGRAQSGPPGNLRAGLTSFVGREQDLAALGELIGTARLVTLTGPGGSGKTRLSVEAGRLAQRGGRWPDGVWQVELAPLEDPAGVPGLVLTALGLRATQLHTTVPEGPVDPVRRIVEHCGQTRMLLLLDNCEHLVQAAAELADQLLAECPGLTVLATSREPLGVPGESVLPVEPLPDPVALRLLAERGAAARPGFQPEDDPAACAEICRRLDGLPLAIELAAARLRSMTPRQLADRLDGRFALLTGGSRVLLPRQQTLRAVVDWSWELLDARERALLGRLAVFAGGWTLEHAELVCADGELVRSGQVAELLFSLVDKSLVVAGLNQAGPPRYWMLETIHEYAAERLAEAGDQGTRLRHLTAFRELVRDSAQHVHSSRQLHLLTVLEREQDNVRAALRHAVADGREPDALALLLGMAWFWMLRDYRAEAADWADRVCALGADPFGEHAPAPEPVEQDPLAYPLPWPDPVLQEARRQAWILNLLTRMEGDLAVMADQATLVRAPRIIQAYHDGLPQTYTHVPMLRIFACFLAGRAEDMLVILDDAVAGCRRYGRQSELAWALQLRAKISNDRFGGLERARADGAEALEIYSRLGDSWGLTESLAAQAETAGFAGDNVGAAASYRRAIELAEELGAPQEVPILTLRLGEAVLDQDQVEGERLIRQGLALAAEGAHVNEGAKFFGHSLLAGLYTFRGEHEAALAEVAALKAARIQFGLGASGLTDALVGSVEAVTLAQAGRLDEAGPALREGLCRLRALPGAVSAFAEHLTLLMLPVMASSLLLLAERGRDQALVRLAGLLIGAHSARTGVQGGFLEGELRRAREQLMLRLCPVEEAERLYAAGRDLSWEEVTALLDEVVDAL
ncbi:AfsR family transcriptional regulator [Streptomyces tateyamensis]|uniref:AfsR family transcriptional regulator n=1 Tax=Streptomyces tateyamensis TaxID=565073 RepID=A0A2V4NPM6_9ACTN|nr:BTAD domain-containing putative transcriptional regulator [Streptomyces tateyamensis]PYC77834.1 AfsR family transcriptional regulator [Streptomyces tateyamensis]